MNLLPGDQERVRLLSDSLSTAVILNPASSGGAGSRIWPKVAAELAHRGIPFELFRTEAPGHARSLSKEVAELGANRILVVGGDGTVHEVANGVLESTRPPPPLAVVPVGTGNDFYRMVGSSRRVEEALSALDGGEIRLFDVGQIRSEQGEWVFVNLLGVGVDVEVLRVREKFHRLRGLPQYLAALAWTLCTFRSQRFRISIRSDHGSGGVECMEGRTLLAAVTVGPSIGGGFLLSPEASPVDGLLDLFLVGPLGPGKIIRFVPRVIRGTHGNIPEIRLRRFVSAVVERPDGGPFFFEMDGERMPDPISKLAIEVRPSALPVLLPRKMQ